MKQNVILTLTLAVKKGLFHIWDRKDFIWWHKLLSYTPFLNIFSSDWCKIIRIIASLEKIPWKDWNGECELDWQRKNTAIGWTMHNSFGYCIAICHALTFFALKTFLLCFIFLTNNELSFLVSSWYWVVNENSVSEVEKCCRGKYLSSRNHRSALTVWESWRCSAWKRESFVETLEQLPVS